MITVDSLQSETSFTRRIELLNQALTNFNNNTLEKPKHLLQYLESEMDSTSSPDWYDACKKTLLELGVSLENTTVESPCPSSAESHHFFAELLDDKVSSDHNYPGEVNVRESSEIIQDADSENIIRDIRTYLELDPKQKIRAITDFQSENIANIREFLLQAILKENCEDVLAAQLLSLPKFFDNDDHRLNAVISLLGKNLYHHAESVSLNAMKSLQFYAHNESSSIREKLCRVFFKACDHRIEPIRKSCQKLLLQVNSEIAAEWLSLKFNACRLPDHLNALSVYSSWPEYEILREQAELRLHRLESTAFTLESNTAYLAVSDQDLDHARSSKFKVTTQWVSTIAQFIKLESLSILGFSMAFNLILMILASVTFYKIIESDLQHAQASDLQTISKEQNDLQKDFDQRDVVISELRAKIASLEKSDTHAFQLLMDQYTKVRGTINTESMRDFMNNAYEFNLRFPRSEFLSGLNPILVDVTKTFNKYVFASMDKDDNQLASDELMQSLRLSMTLSQLLINHDASFSKIIPEVDRRTTFLNQFVQYLDSFHNSLDQGQFEQASNHLEKIKQLSPEREHEDLYQQLASSKYADKLDEIMSLIRRASELSESQGYGSSPHMLFCMYRIHHELGLKSKANRYLNQILNLKPLKQVFSDPDQFFKHLKYLQTTVRPEVMGSFMADCTEAALQIDVDTYGSQARALALIAKFQMQLGDFNMAQVALNKIVLKTDFYDTNSSIIKAHAMLELWRLNPLINQQEVLIQMSKMTPEIFGTNLLKTYAVLEKYDQLIQLAPKVSDLDLKDLVTTLAKQRSYDIAFKLLEDKDLNVNSSMIRASLNALGQGMLNNDQPEKIDELISRIQALKSDFYDPAEAYGVELGIARVRYYISKNNLAEARQLLVDIRASLEGEVKTTVELTRQIAGTLHLSQGYQALQDKNEALKVYEASLQLIKKIPDTESNLVDLKRPLFNELINALSANGYAQQVKKTGLELREYAQGFQEAFVKNHNHLRELALSYAQSGLIKDLKNTLIEIEKSHVKTDLKPIALSEIYLEGALNYSNI